MTIAPLSDLAVLPGLTPVQMIGIPLALIGAVFMSLGAIYQHRGVSKVEAASGTSGAAGLNLKHLLALVSRPSWVIGTVMLGLAVVMQLASFVFTPIIVVQPLGVVSLLLTTLLTARAIRQRLPNVKIFAVALCIIGVGAFVTVAALFAKEKAISDEQVATVLVLLAVVVVVFGTGFFLLRKRFKALIYVLGAGVIYGFVATLAKITINRIQHDNFEWLTLICLVALLVATGVGGYFVQNAYASGPPDMVIAGLTVIDPIIAVAIAIAVLGEASAAPWYAYLMFIVSGAIAVTGVFVLERGQTDAEVEAVRRNAVEGRGALDLEGRHSDAEARVTEQ